MTLKLDRSKPPPACARCRGKRRWSNNGNAACNTCRNAYKKKIRLPVEMRGITPRPFDRKKPPPDCVKCGGKRHWKANSKANCNVCFNITRKKWREKRRTTKQSLLFREPPSNCLKCGGERKWNLVLEAECRKCGNVLGRINDAKRYNDPSRRAAMRQAKARSVGWQRGLR